MATADRWQEIDVALYMYVSLALPIPLDWPPFPEGDERTAYAKDMLQNPELWGLWEVEVWSTPTWLEEHTAYQPGALPEDEELRRMDDVNYINPLKRISDVEIIAYEVEGVEVMVWTVFVTLSIVVVLCPAPPIIQVIPFLPFIIPTPEGDMLGLPLLMNGAGCLAGKRRLASA